ncbi:GGDEF domain-containing protein [Salinivibrio kushneri]|nr:GGDEF domain-containing protein [Salinivibrio kushneri]QCP02770.1 GGDEF domain-containing protein [Salinivibrio kushneri]
MQRKDVAMNGKADPLSKTSLDQFKQYFFDALDVVPLPLLISEGIVSDEISNNNRAHIFFNQAFQQELGYTLDNMPDIYQWFEKAYPDPDYRQEIISQWHQVVHEAQAHGEKTVELPALVTYADGQQRWYAVTAQVDVAPNPDWHIVVFRDIHQLKTSLEETTHASLTDSLTQLANRRGLTDWFAQSAHRTALGTIVLDIDRFKQVNDSLGHIAGDRLLTQIASQLKQFSPPNACCARWGGEEFVIIIPDCTYQHAFQLAKTLCHHVYQEGFLWHATRHQVSLSAGIGFTEAGHHSLDDLVARADQAMYIAKQRGRNQVCGDPP